MSDYATLRDHVRLTCRSIDRIFLQAYVPRLQTVVEVCQYLRWQRGFPIPSSAAFGKIGAAYVDEVHRWAGRNEVPVIHFARGDKKEEIARPLIAASESSLADAQHLPQGRHQAGDRHLRFHGDPGQPRALSARILPWSARPTPRPCPHTHRSAADGPPHGRTRHRRRGRRHDRRRCDGNTPPARRHHETTRSGRTLPEFP
jgi:hypothetical protein